MLLPSTTSPQSSVAQRHRFRVLAGIFESVEGLLERRKKGVRQRQKKRRSRRCRETAPSPSSKLITPIWPDSVLRDYIRPKLRPVELGWINFAVLRRSHSTLHKQRNSDLKVIADQQVMEYGLTWTNTSRAGVAERKAEAAKLYAEFNGVLHKQG
jgi:hypothetical protein